MGELEKERECIAALKELADNMLEVRDSYKQYSGDWHDCNARYQSYTTAYIRAKNMLDYQGSGKSFKEFVK